VSEQDNKREIAELYARIEELATRMRRFVAPASCERCGEPLPQGYSIKIPYIEFPARLCVLCLRAWVFYVYDDETPDETDILSSLIPCQVGLRAAERVVELAKGEDEADEAAHWLGQAIAEYEDARKDALKLFDQWVRCGTKAVTP